MRVRAIYLIEKRRRPIEKLLRRWTNNGVMSRYARVRCMTQGVFNHRLELLPREEVYAIRDSAMILLEKVGFRYKHPKALSILEEHGALVDRRKEVARLPGELVAECLSRAPKKYAVEPPDGDAIRFGDGGLKAEMCLEMNLIDYKSLGCRRGAMEDCVKSIVLGNELDGISVVSPFVVPVDVPLEVVDVYEYRLLFEFSWKPCYAWIYSAKSSRYIIEMARLIAGGEEELRKRKLVGYGAEPTSPLQLSRHSIEILMEMARHDLPISASGSMITLGATGPITIAGALSLQTAEVLAGITLVHLLNPETPIGFSTSLHVLDQRTGLCSFGAPENTLACLAGIQVARSLGLSCFCNIGLTDSNSPDFQAGFEKAFSTALVLAAGAEGIGSQGIVGADQGASWEQLVIDDEWLNAINRVFQAFDVNEETLALEVIRKAGIGGNFLGNRHTLEHLRSELWHPKLLNRERWTGDGASDVLAKANTSVENILKEHLPPTPAVDRDLAKRLDVIVRKAEKDLLKQHSC